MHKRDFDFAATPRSHDRFDGMIQHAIYGVPRRLSGYTTDDNARALRLCARLSARHPSKRMLSRVTKYLSFLEYARCPTRRLP